MIPSIRFRAAERTVLCGLLDEVVAPGSVTLVDAPEGCGKTTLLSQWARGKRAAGEPVVWLSFTNVPQGAGIAESLGLQRRVGGDWPVGLRRATVRPDALGEVSARTTLILDEYPTKSGRALNQELHNLVSTQPTLSVVVAGRDLTALRELFSETSVGSGRITQEDLAFTDEEILRLCDGVGVDFARFSGAVVTSFGAWPMGVSIMLQGLTEGKTRSEILDAYTGARFFVLPNDAARQIVSAAAHLPRLRVPVLAASLGLTEAQVTKTFKELQNTSVLRDGRDCLGRFYCLPEGLRHHYRHHGNDVWSGDSLQRVRKAHALAEAEIEPVKALEVLVEADQLAEAQALIGRYFTQIIDEGDRSLAALQTLTFARLEQYPGLFLARLVLERPLRETPIGTVDEMAARLHRAITAGRDGAWGRDRAAAMSMQIAAASMLGLWQQALTAARELLGKLGPPSNNIDLAEDPNSPIYFAVIALTGILMGEFELARAAADQGFRVATEQDNTLEQVHALSLGAVVGTMTGNLADAHQKIDDAGRLEDSAPTNPPEFSWADGEIARVFLSYYSGDVQLGDAALRKLVPVMTRMEQWPMVVVSEALWLHRTRGGNEALAQMKTRIYQQTGRQNSSPFWEAAIWCVYADMATYSGRVDEAASTLRDLDTNVRIFGVGAKMRSLSKARLELFRGHYAKTVALCRRIILPETAPQMNLEKELMLALAEYELGDTQSSRGRLRTIEKMAGDEDLAPLLSSVPFELLSEASRSLNLPDLERAVSALPSPMRAEQYGMLSATERELLQTLALGGTLEEVARKMFVSVNTVKTHQRSIYKKLRANTRAEAMAAAWKLGLLE